MNIYCIDARSWTIQNDRYTDDRVLVRHAFYLTTLSPVNETLAGKSTIRAFTLLNTSR